MAKNNCEASTVDPRPKDKLWCVGESGRREEGSKCASFTFNLWKEVAKMLQNGSFSYCTYCIFSQTHISIVIVTRYRTSKYSYIC